MPGYRRTRFIASPIRAGEFATTTSLPGGAPADDRNSSDHDGIGFVSCNPGRGTEATRELHLKPR
jgi:hypothetical protein